MRIMQKLIGEATKEQMDDAMHWIDNKHMDLDYSEIYHLILECGMTAYGAAAELGASRTHGRSAKTLWRHARDIEIYLLDFLGGITIDSLLKTLLEKGEVACPDEILNEFRAAVRENKEVMVEENVIFKVRGAKDLQSTLDIFDSEECYGGGSAITNSVTVQHGNNHEPLRESERECAKNDE
jgi:hypothetical protein